MSVDKPRTAHKALYVSRDYRFHTLGWCQLNIGPMLNTDFNKTIYTGVGWKLIADKRGMTWYSDIEQYALVAHEEFLTLFAIECADFVIGACEITF